GSSGRAPWRCAAGPRFRLCLLDDAPHDRAKRKCIGGPPGLSQKSSKRGKPGRCLLSDRLNSNSSSTSRPPTRSVLALTRPAPVAPKGLQLGPTIVRPINGVFRLSEPHYCFCLAPSTKSSQEVCIDP